MFSKSAILMKYVIWSGMLIIIISCGKSDKQEDKSSDEVLEAEIYEYDTEIECTYQKRPAAFINSTPFGQSDKIEIVSYSTRDLRESGNELINNGKFIVSDIKQRVALNKTDQDSLFSILYNVTVTGDQLEYPGADCYSPQHCIVFYKNNQAFAYYEICFMCSRTQQSNGFGIVNFCEEKWCLLQKFFKTKKANYGLIDEMCG